MSKTVTNYALRRPICPVQPAFFLAFSIRDPRLFMLTARAEVCPTRVDVVSQCQYLYLVVGYACTPD